MYGLLLNIFNPKAYASLITILTPVVIPIKSTKEQPFGIILLVLLCLAVVAHIDAAWLLAGAKLGMLLKSHLQVRWLNNLCSIATVASILMT
ncbi:hypothetical protein [Pseudoalteromonas sp. MMG005]|uniref:Uncharacterized protein n=1 Tax=Pseudoalteromonas aurantia 208 TaxID=1314867 RepID=A0ABR9EIB8_9GAMM|nr:hypothetical protein [Pseudoalteromonas sp. MMG005]MBE0370674.1 hypothetical protein [Pseudoalteromonas aurantia 208]MBQ4845504.1 hypothetical protein [Pseudoalteromonas sp. MMG005]